MAKTKQQDESAVRATLVISPRDMRKPDENPYATVARKLTRPEVTAAAVLQPLAGEAHNINALIAELTIQVAEVKAGDMSRPEAMLVSQSHTLDGLFSNLTRKAIAKIDGGYLDAGERFLRLAFKAQSQCRTTIETLAEFKNPRPVAFVRQANISNGPQQVNNGGGPNFETNTRTPVRPGEFENPQSKLLEAQRHEWMDTGAAAATSATNPALEAVGTVNRADDRGR